MAEDTNLNEGQVEETSTPVQESEQTQETPADTAPVNEEQAA